MIPTRPGSPASAPQPLRLRWSWQLIAGVDAASGIGMLALGVAASGLARVIALTLGLLVLVESGCLAAGPARGIGRHGSANRPQ